MDTARCISRRHHRSLQPGRQRQRGAATLIVVMVLFFVMSLAAAYASRNLIFEQRTSANQYASTQSAEAAEAGMEWAVSMLNSGRIGDDCEPTADVSKKTYRERYLITDPATGAVTRRQKPGGGVLWSACSFDGTGWRCTCPGTDLSAASLPAGPAFGVRFVSVTTKSGLVRVEVNGCTSADLACMTAGTVTLTASCQSTLCSLLALHSGVKTPPAAAVTARGSISGASLTASNPSVQAGGITLHAGAGISVVTPTLSSAPGTPASQSVIPSDTPLHDLPDDAADCLYCTFTSVFGLRPVTYQRQGGALHIDCASACTAAQVNAALGSKRAGKVVVLTNTGGLRLTSPADNIDSLPSDPVVLVIEGPLVIDAAASGARIHGLVYAASAAIDGGVIQGALVTPGNVVGNGSAAVAYDAAIVNQLQLTSGSYVRLPGAWRDFP